MLVIISSCCWIKYFFKCKWFSLHTMLAKSSIYTSETYLLIFNKDANIVICSTSWYFFYSKTVFFLWKYNIVCWIVLPNILDSSTGYHKHIMLTWESSIFIVWVFQLICCCNQDYLTFFYGYFTFPNKYISAELEKK